MKEKDPKLLELYSAKETNSHLLLLLLIGV